MPLSPVDIRVWEWIEYHLSHLFWPLVKLVAFCSSTRMSPPRHPSTFRKFKLLCNECSFMRTWWSFLLAPLWAEQNWSLPWAAPEYHHQYINTTFLKIQNSGECCDAWHRTVTFNLSPQFHSVRSAFVQHCSHGRVGVEWVTAMRASRAALGADLVRALPVLLHRTHCTVDCALCCNVNCVEMYNIHMCTSNVHFHCTALFSIAASVLQFVHSTELHCSAFQSVCCAEQSLPCSALWCG